MKTLKSTLFLVIFILPLINCPSEKKDDSMKNLMSLITLQSIARGSTGSSTNTGSTGTSTSTSGLTFTISAGANAAVAGETLSLTITGTGSGTTTDTIMLSSNSIISSIDTTAKTGESLTSGTNTVSITIPSTIVTTTPATYYIGLLTKGTVTSTPILIVPSGSAIAAYSFNTALSNITLDATTKNRYYEVDLVNGVNFVMSAYSVAGGLDVILSLHTLTGSLSQVDSRTTNNYERTGVTVSTTGKGWLEVKRSGATAGTFSFLAANSSITSSGSIATGGGSCNGGTGTFANRCVDFDTSYTSKPASDANCVTLQGTGSTYSAGTCSTTNRVARCHVNPLSNNGRITLTFYSTNDTTTTANTTCNGDILSIP